MLSKLLLCLPDRQTTVEGDEAVPDQLTIPNNKLPWLHHRFFSTLTTALAAVCVHVISRRVAVPITNTKGCKIVVCFLIGFFFC